METIIGVFSERVNAEKAIADLERKGYSPRDLSVIVREKDVVTPVKAGSKGGNAVSGALSGAATGGVIGGITGLLIGVGAVTIPGIGAFLIGGPLAAALGLTGAAAVTASGVTTGLLAGGLLGGLVGLGVPEEAARIYEQRVREGAVLLAVPAATEEKREEIRGIFDRYGADQTRTIGEMSFERL